MTFLQIIHLVNSGTRSALANWVRQPHPLILDEIVKLIAILPEGQKLIGYRLLDLYRIVLVDRCLYHMAFHLINEISPIIEHMQKYADVDVLHAIPDLTALQSHIQTVLQRNQPCNDVVDLSIKLNEL